MVAAVALAGAVATGARAAGAGELEKASSAVHGSSSSSSSSRSSSSGSSGSSGSSSEGGGSSGGGGTSDSDDTSGAGAEVFGYLFLSLFTLPHAAVEGDAPFSSEWSIASHPYAGGAPGYFAHVGAAEEEGGYAVPSSARRFAGLQLALEGMPSLGSAPGRAQGSVRILTVYRLEFDAAYALYVEPADQGAQGGGTSAWLGHAHAAFRFAQGEHVQFRAGLGMRHWIDQQGSSFGVDGLYAFDIFWGRPVTTSVELSGGTLGDAWAAEARGTVGFVLGRGEIYGGYDALWIGSPQAGPVAYLGGPVLGVKAYF